MALGELGKSTNEPQDKVVVGIAANDNIQRQMNRHQVGKLMEGEVLE